MATTKKNNGRFKGKSRGDNRTERSKGHQNTRRSPDKRNDDVENHLNDYNDFSWYNANPLLTAATARIPFPYKPGMLLPIGSQPDDTVVNRNFELPGTLAIQFDLMAGYSESVTDPLSLAAKELYGKVRAAFSGTLPEDAPDLMIYMLALDSIYASIAEMKRFYRIIGSYSPLNYSVPISLLRATSNYQQLSVQYVESEKVQLWQYINELIGMVSKFTAPRIMHVMDRHYWLNDNVYGDANSPMAQMYVFVMRNAYIFGLDTQGIGQLKPFQPKNGVNFGASGWAYQWYTNVRSMIEALANSEDAYTINGHLMKAFEGVPMFSVAPLNQNELFIPVYEPEVLSQIENVVTVNAAASGTPIVQNPSTNALVSKPTITLNPTVTDYIWDLNLLNIHKEMPNEADVVIASRLTPALNFTSSTDGNNKYEVHCGTELPVGFTYWGNVDYYKFRNDYLYDFSGTADPTDVDALGWLLLLDAFDWHPFIRYTVVSKATPSNTVRRGIYGDIYNITQMESRTLAEIHRVCMFSEYGAFQL